MLVWTFIMWVFSPSTIFFPLPFLAYCLIIKEAEAWFCIENKI